MTPEQKKIADELAAGRRGGRGLQPLVVKTAAACGLLGIGQNTVYKLMDAGDLDYYLEGSIRKITMASIVRYINRQIKKTKAAPKRPVPNREKLLSRRAIRVVSG